MAVDGSATGGADAFYEYDISGNLTDVALSAYSGSAAFTAWRDRTYSSTEPDAQLRKFRYDALGRLKISWIPEKGKSRSTGPTTEIECGASPPADWECIDSYDVLGNVLTYRTPQAIERGYFFENEYDTAGRLVETRRVRGTPSSPSSTDVDRLEGAGSFNSGLSGWQEGTLDANGDFQSGSSYWTGQAFDGVSCISTPPSTSSTDGLYFGDQCEYSGAPSGAEVVRTTASGVTRDDALEFLFWRKVREGGGGTHDALSIQVGLSGSPSSERRTVFRLDDDDRSYATWRRVPSIRIGDFFPDSAWAEGTTKTVEILIVFEKGDTGTAGLGEGVMLADMILGTRAIEKLGSHVYDQDTCPREACNAGTGSNAYLGKPTSTTSYLDGREVSSSTYAYRGLNGRESGVATKIDWALAGGTPVEWTRSASYDDLGRINSTEAPAMPGIDSIRTYGYSHDRDALVGIVEDRGAGYLPIDFFDSSVPGLAYDRSGALTGIAYANGANVTIARDVRSRPLSYAATAGGGSDGWSSGAYTYDGAGNIASIGGQAYSYDAYGRLTAARVLPQALDKNETNPWEVAYTDDLYGNLTGRHHMGTSKSADRPTVLEFDHTVASSPTETTRNQIEESYFAYDADGNMTRLSEDNGSLMSMYWDDRGRMTAVGMNQPEVAPTAHTISERYVYDAAGYRLLRIPESTTVGGNAIGIQIRDGAGQLLSEYAVDSSNGSPALARDYVYGAGQLLIERTVVENFPTVTTSTNFAQGGTYGFTIDDPEPASTYVVDVRTESGYQTTVSGIVPDGSGNFTLSDSTFALDAPNYLRVRRDGDGEAYSPSLTISIDSTITGSSPNPIRAVSVSRSGNSVILRWEQLAVSGLPTTLWFDRGDGSPLTMISIPLSSSTTSYTLALQSLSTGCGTILGTQPVGQGGSPVPTIGGPVPDPTATQHLSTGFSGSCNEDPPPPAWDGYTFAESFHVRDHLGTLRLETGAGGEVTGRHDFYPFGAEVPEPGGGVATKGSRKRYTGHEWDAETNLDYMLARYYGGSLGRFVSVDGGSDIVPSAPLSWNSLTYVRNTPINLLDPDGERAAFFLGTGETPAGGKKGGTPALLGVDTSVALANVDTHVIDGPRAWAPGSIGRRSRTGAGFFLNRNTPDPTRELVGFSRGAIAAVKAARKLGDAGIRADLLVTIDPELRSNLKIPTNVDYAVNISDDRSFRCGMPTDDRASAAGAGPKVFNLRLTGVPDRGSHGDTATVTASLVQELTLRAEQGGLSEQYIRQAVSDFNQAQAQAGSPYRLSFKP